MWPTVEDERERAYMAWRFAHPLPPSTPQELAYLELSARDAKPLEDAFHAWVHWLKAHGKDDAL